MDRFVISTLPSKEIAPGVTLRSVYLRNVMVTFVELAEGSEVPMHSHPHEQISLVIKGKLWMKVGEKEMILSPGEGTLVPSAAEHTARPVDGPALAYDCWSPIREDYILDK